MNIQAQQIIKEIHELITQYQREVPGRRRAWPQSIKVRVIQLSQDGWSPKQVAEATGISYYSVVAWIPKEYRRQYRRRESTTTNTAEFSPLRIRGNQEIARVTVEKSTKDAQIQNCATVTVTLRGGIRIKGVTPEFLRAWLGERS